MKKGLIALALFMIPFAVYAEVPSDAQAVAANTEAKNTIDESLKQNGSLKNATKGYYIEGIEINCTNNKYNHTIYNESIKDTLTCSNGNTAPYLDIKSDGTESVASGNTCSETDKLYASRIYLYDCNYTGTKDNKTEFVSNKKGNITIIANNGVSFTNNTSESSGTLTFNENTGTKLSASCTDKCELVLNLKISSGYKLLGSSRDNCATIEDVAVKNEKIRLGFDNNTNDSITLCTQATNTGTTDNKDTGVEDYFIALGSIGIVVIGLLYFLDKKNVFKRI